MVETKNTIKKTNPIEQLVKVADEIFERAIKLDGIKLKKEDENVVTINETRNEVLDGCIKIWKVIIAMLPTSDFEQSKRKELIIDGYKVISRCYHLLNNLNGAKQNISKAIDAGYIDGFISLGAICLDLGQYEEAESAFNSAIAKNAMAIRAHAGLGELYFAMGTEKIKSDPSHTEYFTKSEEEFLIAGKARFTDGFDRAMDLFETIGWKDKAHSIGEKALHFYEDNKSSYGEKLRSLDMRIRKLAGDERHDQLILGVGRQLGRVLGGKKD